MSFVYRQFRKHYRRHECLIVMLLGGALVAWSSVPGAVDGAAERHEAVRHRVPTHAAEFTTISERTPLVECGDSHPPQAVATPDPVFEAGDPYLPVQVSFIVGADGHIYSPFILDSGGERHDAAVLRAIGGWRYRPATCNGVPTEVEARVKFRTR